jgi:hypothetical protein
MTSEEAIQVADKVLLDHIGIPLTDIQRIILQESVADKRYEEMKGYAPGGNAELVKNSTLKISDVRKGSITCRRMCQ